MSNASFGRSLKTNGSIGVDKLENILKVYSDINPIWILTGDGSMLKSEKEINIENKFSLRTDNNINQQQIPLYKIEATTGIMPLFKNSDHIDTDEYISIPHLPKCDGALFVTGDSMYPLLKSGDIIAYQKVNDLKNDLFWGEMYLVSINMNGEEYVTVKYIQKSDEGKDYIKLVSENKQHQPKDVHLSKVNAAAFIKATVRINAM